MCIHDEIRKSHSIRVEDGMGAGRTTSRALRGRVRRCLRAHSIRSDVDARIPVDVHLPLLPSSHTLCVVRPCDRSLVDVTDHCDQTNGRKRRDETGAARPSPLRAPRKATTTRERATNNDAMRRKQPQRQQQHSTTDRPLRLRSSAETSRQRNLDEKEKKKFGKRPQALYEEKEPQHTSRFPTIH